MLREKVIEQLKAHPERLRMTIYLRRAIWPNEGCGTVGCLAGNIVMAADVPICERDGVLRLEPLPDTKLEELLKGFARDNHVPACARHVWAQEYGEAAAQKLPFFIDDWASEVGFAGEFENPCHDTSKAFCNLKAEDVIKYLESLPEKYPEVYGPKEVLDG